MNAVVKKIETILKSPYNTKNYVDLIREIFPKVNMVSPDKFRKEFTCKSTSPLIASTGHDIWARSYIGLCFKKSFK